MELVRVPPFRLSLKAARAVHLMFVGDIQWAGNSSHGTALTELKETLARGMQHGAWFVGMGDYIDFASPSNRQRLQAAALYDTAQDVIDQKALELTAELYEEALAPTKGRWLGLLEGHHFTQLREGDTTDMRLCHMLGAPFLGTCGVLRVGLESCGARTGFTVWVHHGHGNGQTGYYPLARLEKTYADHEGVDVFVVGHTTKMGVLAKNRISYVWSRGRGQGVHRTSYLVAAGGYSRSYIEGAKQGLVPRDGYALKRMLGPSVIGSPMVTATLARRRGQTSTRIHVTV